MDVLLTVNEYGVLENAEFDDIAGLDVEPDFEDVVDIIHRTTVVIPCSVTRIGDRAFHDKRWLLGAIIPSSVTSIGNDAFSDCYYMESVTIPGSVAIIGSRAFRYCEGLASVVIMNETTLIAGDAFFGCSEALTIRARKGSSAERHAAENALRFEPI